MKQSTNLKLFIATIFLSVSTSLFGADLEFGKITDINVELDKRNKDKILFSITLEQAFPGDNQNVQNSILTSFVESSIATETKKGAFIIHLDAIGKLNYKMPKSVESFYLDSIELSETNGSYNSPNIQQTKTNRQIKSALFTFRTNLNIYYQFIEINNDKKDVVIFKFALQKDNTSTTQIANDTIVIDMTDADTVASKFISSKKIPDKLIQQLKSFKDNDYVTMNYPLEHIKPNEADAIIKKNISILGRTASDNNANSLIITDRKDYMINHINILRSIDKAIPQVLIEVKILEISWSKSEQIGFNWGFSTDNQKGKYVNSALNTNQSKLAGQNPLSSVVFGKLGSESMRILNAQIELLAKDGKVNILATPKLKVLNNKKAVFQAGQKIPVLKLNNYKNTGNKNIKSYDQNDLTDTKTDTTHTITNIDSIEDNSTDINTFDINRSQSFIDVGVGLTVTPSIKSGDEIILDILPTVSSISGWNQITGLPIVQSRSINTSVRVKSGENLMIGGLFKEKEVIENRGIPGLRKIPLLGRLFSSKKKVKQKTEVIFILKITSIK